MAPRHTVSETSTRRASMPMDPRELVGESKREYIDSVITRLIDFKDNINSKDPYPVLVSGILDLFNDAVLFERER